MTVNQSTLDSLKQRAEEYGEQLVTEEATKNALVMPMLMAMGYEPFNPAEVVPEFTADIGTKRGEKVDYAIMRNGKPAILFECKKFGDSLNADRASQLMRYFNVTDAMVGCLTNGVVYKFFTDTDADNVMDEAPFLVVDLYNLNNNAIQGLGQLTKAGFSEDVFQIVGGEDALHRRDEKLPSPNAQRSERGFRQSGGKILLWRVDAPTES